MTEEGRLLFIFIVNTFRPESELEHDQKLNGLKQIPSLLETLSYCYFFGGFLIGPQFPLRLYRQFYTGELWTHPKGHKELPSNLVPTLRFWSFFIFSNQQVPCFRCPVPWSSQPISGPLSVQLYGNRSIFAQNLLFESTRFPLDHL